MIFQIRNQKWIEVFGKGKKWILKGSLLGSLVMTSLMTTNCTHTMMPEGKQVTTTKKEQTDLSMFRETSQIKADFEQQEDMFRRYETAFGYKNTIDFQYISKDTGNVLETMKDSFYHAVYFSKDNWAFNPVDFTDTIKKLGEEQVANNLRQNPEFWANTTLQAVGVSSSAEFPLITTKKYEELRTMLEGFSFDLCEVDTVNYFALAKINGSEPLPPSPAIIPSFFNQDEVTNQETDILYVQRVQLKEKGEFPNTVQIICNSDHLTVFEFPYQEGMTFCLELGKEVPRGNFQSAEVINQTELTTSMIDPIQKRK